jgi:opacity protein-like surface antigen
MADTNSWYIGGAIGAADVNDQDITRIIHVGAITSTSRQRATMPSDSSWSGTIGHRYSPSFAVELELTHRSSGSTRVINLPSGGNATGNPLKLSSDSLFVNSIYTLPIDGPVRPYLGGGVGSVRTRMVATDSLGTASSSKSSIGYQLLAGVEWQLAQAWSLFAQVQFLEVPSYDQATSLTVATTTTTRSVHKYQSRSYAVGVRYSF